MKKDIKNDVAAVVNGHEIVRYPLKNYDVFYVGEERFKTLYAAIQWCKKNAVE